MSSTTWIALRAALSIAVVFLCLSLGAAKPPRSLEVVAGERSIGVAKASPGAKLILIGYEYAFNGESRVVRHVRREANAGPTGSASFDLNRELAARGFWVAFDLSSGAYGAAAQGKHGLREAELPSRLLKKSASGKFEKVETRFELMHVIAIRPGIGAWDRTAGDGAEGDDDLILNGQTNVSAQSLRGIAGTTQDLDELKDGDLLAIFLPGENGYLVTEVKK